MSAWVNVTVQLPDDDLVVLVALDCGEVWPAYHLDDRWLYVTGDTIESSTITHWMEMPAHPVQEAA